MVDFVRKEGRRRVLAGMVAYHTVANIFYQYGKPAVPFLEICAPDWSGTRN